MWLWRALLFAALALVQTAVVGDTLNRLAAEPAFEPNFAAVLAPTFVYLGIFALWIAAGYVRALIAYVVARPERRVQLGDGSSQYASLRDVDARQREASAACIYAGDASVELIMFALMLAFAILLAQRLGNPDGRAFLVVFVPLFLYFGFLLVVFAVAAGRTQAEKRYESPMGSRGCCDALFGGVLLCCSDDSDALAEARFQRADNKPSYVAEAEFQALPCAYMCTPALAFGTLDLIAAALTYAMLLAALISTILLGVRLDSAARSPTLAAVFAPLFAVESALIVVSVALYVSLVCNYRRPVDRPPGRTNIVGKHAEVLATIFFVALLVLQQALLAARVDAATPSDADWLATLTPLLVLFSLVLYCGCCGIQYCSRDAQEERRARRREMQYATQTGAAPTRLEEASVHDRTYSRLPSSHYGVFASVPSTR